MRKYNLLSLFKSIRMAILIPYGILICLTSITILLVSLNYTEDEVLNNSIDYTTRLIQQVHSDVDSYINYMENISALTAQNRDVQSYMSSDTKNEELFQQITMQFETILNTRKDISNIGIISSNGKYIFNDGTDQLNEHSNYQNQEWYEKSLQNKGAFLSTSHVQNIIQNRYTWVVTLSRPIYNSEHTQRCGTFFIDLNYQIIRDLCVKNYVGNDCYIFIIDKSGNIIYHPQQQLLYNNLKSEPITDILNTDETHFIMKQNGEKMLYAISKQSNNDWMVVGAVNTSELTKNKKETQYLYCLLCIGLLLVSILMSQFISSAITKPIKRLSTSMKQVEEGNFVSSAVKVNNEAELGELAKTFNRMVLKIDYLMKQNINEQKQKRISEMRVLQAQINPHFLYNTLDSIIWMAEDGQDEEVVLMTSSLSKLLRQSISNNNELVTIAEEIDYTKNYLTIQKIRYKDKLNYDIQIDPAILSCSIVKLVVQPIVENSIYHGIKNKAGNGNIYIRGYMKENDIYIEIEDDGIGMSEETLAHILEPKKDTSSDSTRKHVGIQNVQQRLQLQYSIHYGLSFSSIEGQKTQVTIHIPRVTGGDVHET